MATELDPKILEYMEKYGVTLAAVTSAMKANATTSKGLNSEALKQVQAQAQLTKSLQKNLKLSEAEAISTAKKLKQEEEAADKQKKLSDEQEKIDKGRVDAAKQFVSELKNFVTSSISAGQSVYNSSQSFAAVIPTVQLMGTAVKAVAQAMAGLGGGIPIISGLFSGAEKLVGAAVDITVSSMQAQIENAQKMVDTYKNLSKVGLTFGGSLDGMVEAAGNAGMSLDSYAKFATSNIDSLRVMGGSTEAAAARVTKMGKTIIDNNPKLLAMYGSMEDVQGVVADYAAMQARYGIDTTRNTKELTLGAQDYLYNMKELSALTGKSADDLKKREEERSRMAAYQLAMGRMDATQQKNTRTSIETTAKVYGDIAEKYATEFVATNGRVTSEQALLFKSIYPEIAATIGDSLGLATTAKDNFIKQNADLVNSRKDTIRGEVEAKESLFKLYAGGVGVGDKFMDTVNSVGSATLKSYTAQADLIKASTEIEKLRQEEASKATLSFASTIKSLNEYKKTIDQQTLDTIPKLGGVVTDLIKVQEQINEKVGRAMPAAVEKVTKELGKMFDELDKINKSGNVDLFKQLTTGPGSVLSLLGFGSGGGGGGGMMDMIRQLFTGGSPAEALAKSGIKAGKPTPNRQEFEKANPFKGKGMLTQPSGLNFKAGFQANGESDLRLQDMLNSLARDFPGATVTAANDSAKHKGGHTAGRAIDITLPKKYLTNDPSDTVDWSNMDEETKKKALASGGWTMKPDKATAEAIKQVLAGYGFDPNKIYNEYHKPSAKATAGHIHAEFAKGGVVDGTDGGKNITVGEGGYREGVFPADPNNPFPFKLDANQFQEWIGLQREQNAFLEKILHASS
jgi:hypothetical protein